MMCGARVPTARLALDVSHAPKPETLARGLGARGAKCRIVKLSRLVALRYTVPVSQRTKVPLDQPVVHEQPGWSETIP